MKERMIEGGGAALPRICALVVDDRDDVAMGLALLLRQLGHKVHVAGDAGDALRKGDLFEPDVVFLDIGLPDRSGYEVCSQMRGSAWGAKAFIVAVTGRNEPSDLLRAAQTGFDRHEGKPMGFNTLREIMRTVENRTA